jgi:hypothetical protein
MAVVPLCTQEVNHVYILFSITQIIANTLASLDKLFCDLGREDEQCRSKDDSLEPTIQPIIITSNCETVSIV